MTWLERVAVTASSGVRVGSFDPAWFSSEISGIDWEAARLMESTVVVGVPVLGPGAAKVVTAVVSLSAVNRWMHIIKPTLYI